MELYIVLRDKIKLFLYQGQVGEYKVNIYNLWFLLNVDDICIETW